VQTLKSARTRPGVVWGGSLDNDAAPVVAAKEDGRDAELDGRETELDGEFVNTGSTAGYSVRESGAYRLRPGLRLLPQQPPSNSLTPALTYAINATSRQQLWSYPQLLTSA
jgi:hypothetical protein